MKEGGEQVQSVLADWEEGKAREDAISRHYLKAQLFWVLECKGVAGEGSWTEKEVKVCGDKVKKPIALKV